MLLLILAACASPVTMPDIDARVAALLPADALLVGEQHDAPGHQDAHRRVVESLAARNALAAVAVEMAEQGRSTAGLPRDASESAVRSALGWEDAGWPWAPYAPAVMAAVRAGVPVVGANLERSRLREAMGDERFDRMLPEAAMQAQRDAVREGHCGLLPERQIGPMARVQVARDVVMARVVTQASAPGSTVVLLAGNHHVDPQLGVPLHMPADRRVRTLMLPAQPQQKDYCAQLERQLKPAPRP